jgi:hypothetical protein
MLKTLFLSLLLICLAQIAQASQQDDKPLPVVLSIDKLHYYIAEPIHINGLLYNTQENTIKMLTVDQSISYRKIGHDFVPYTSNVNFSRGFMSVLPTEFKPNEKISREETLLYNTHTNQYVLDEPGTYEFQVTMSITLVDGGSKYYTSKIKQVTVSEPPDRDKAALKILKKYDIGYFLNGLESQPLYSFEWMEEPAKKTALFIKKYPNSFYTPLVSKQLKANLNKVKEELELTEQANGEELPPELKNVRSWVKALMENETIETGEDEQ